MDKLLSKKDSVSEKKELVRDILEEDVEKAKLRRIDELIGKETTEKSKNIKMLEPQEPKGDFLSYIFQFKEWLDQRTYIRGDLDKIATWIRNLYKQLNIEESNLIESECKEEKIKLKEQFKRIPLNFIEEKMRTALLKKFRGAKNTTSDAYYLKKLKGIVQEKLKEATYYEILQRILEM